MSAPAFSIGIDLGTTNCAMAFAALDSENAPSQVFSIAQWQAVDRLIESPTLPSFLYLPTSAESAQLASSRSSSAADWLCGSFARKRAGETPGRVVHSAKSWLGHHAVDRSAAFLPWGSDEVPQVQKISPIRASALLLNYLRGAWDSRFPESPFDSQEITITVPASFDAVAQRLTLDAAAEAGFPTNVRLLEEPQAAFYHWLEAHTEPAALWSQLPENGGNVLVIDIGGGTSDFSLFEVARQSGTPHPAIRRIAVSDHLLLGGDNIDLAIAHAMEPRFAGKGETLAGSQWQDLVARCRDLKERCLAADGLADEEFTVSLPGRGSSLFAGILSARIARHEITTILLDGFYPDCPSDARPVEPETALKEWGLPYAADSAVTRYLAHFLRDLPPVDAILFNGGSLYPEGLRKRIQHQIGDWQNDHPCVLENPEPDLAVARGAARFGHILHHRSARIQAGAARSIYLEVHQGGGRSLVCILPRGAEPEVEFQISHPGLELRLNRPVRFQVYASTRHDRDQAGTLVPFKFGEFHKLPPLQTSARLAENFHNDCIPVKLTAKLTELGLLHLECVSAEPAVSHAWPLAFNLRAAEENGGMVAGESDPSADPESLAAAQNRIISIFSAHFDPADPLTAARLLKSLESILGAPKNEWNLMLIRAIWTALKRCTPCRANSVEHEESWLILAGFFLRPGFGAELDSVRIDGLWKPLSSGPIHRGKQVQLQQYILWRRLAGGLNRERQQALIDNELPKLRAQKNPPAELVRLAGSLERIDAHTKSELVELFLAKSLTSSYAAPYFVSLGLLLNRTPLYAGPEAVVAPALVARAYDALEESDWKSPELAELFLRAARVTDHRNLDLPNSLRKQIVRKLEDAGIPAFKVVRVAQFIPVERAEQASLYGESLPPGLILAGR